MAFKRSSVMACWAAASVAMEFWQIDAGELERRIASGETTTSHDFGRTLIDIAPRPLVITTTGPTFTPIEPDPADALAEAMAAGDWRRSRQVTAVLRRRAA